MHHCHAIRMCGAVITDKFCEVQLRLSVEHSVVLHLNKIAIGSKVASESIEAGEPPDRSRASRMPLAEVSRACKLEPCFARLSGVLSNKFASKSRSPVAIVRDFSVLDFNVVLESESFAEVSASSNAKFCSASTVIETKVACSSRVTCHNAPARPNELS